MTWYAQAITLRKSQSVIHRNNLSSAFDCWRTIWYEANCPDPQIQDRPCLSYQDQLKSASKTRNKIFWPTTGCWKQIDRYLIYTVFLIDDVAYPIPHPVPLFQSDWWGRKTETCNWRDQRSPRNLGMHQACEPSGATCRCVLSRIYLFRIWSTWRACCALASNQIVSTRNLDSCELPSLWNTQLCTISQDSHTSLDLPSPLENHNHSSGEMISSTAFDHAGERFVWKCTNALIYSKLNSWRRSCWSYKDQPQNKAVCHNLSIKNHLENI